ncbi:MAG: nuclear transport factor 2 family protein [Myxococcales bacterium]|nr:nuclear transport factor 2 family protein [Myxococcales bacterium]
MTSLVTKTEMLIAAIDSGNIEALSSLLADNIVFEFPSAPSMSTKSEVLDHFKTEFEEHLFSNPPIIVHRIFFTADTTVVEFTINTGEHSLGGVEVLEWENEKVVALRAYINGIHPKTGEMIV